MQLILSSQRMHSPSLTGCRTHASGSTALANASSLTFQAKVELLQAAELLIVHPALACAGTASGGVAATLHRHLLQALRCAQDGAEQHDSLLCATINHSLGCEEINLSQALATST